MAAVGPRGDLFIAGGQGFVALSHGEFLVPEGMSVVNVFYALALIENSEYSVKQVFPTPESVLEVLEANKKDDGGIHIDYHETIYIKTSFTKFPEGRVRSLALSRDDKAQMALADYAKVPSAERFDAGDTATFSWK